MSQAKEQHGSFCTAVNCMDGRFQEPVIAYLKKRLGVSYVDMITEPGPNRILAAGTDAPRIQSILARIRISVEKHHSRHIAVIGHEDCAGNPSARPQQAGHTRRAVEYIAQSCPGVQVIGLWASLDGAVVEV